MDTAHTESDPQLLASRCGPPCAGRCVSGRGNAHPGLLIGPTGLEVASEGRVRRSGVGNSGSVTVRISPLTTFVPLQIWTPGEWLHPRLSQSAQRIKSILYWARSAGSELA